jgi:S-DNA-T family DNA segregation ATPase FtsK/SpoIIIE
MGMNKRSKDLAKTIETYYRSYGVNMKASLHKFLPKYDRFIFQLKILPGTKVDAIWKNATDIRMALNFPLFHPYLDESGIFLVVSRESICESSLQNMLNRYPTSYRDGHLAIALGYNLLGEMVFDNLDEMPHALYAGSTMSGKSSGLICLVMSLIAWYPVQTVNIIIFDIGASSMDVFERVPHLSYPIVKDSNTGAYVLSELTQEMERRVKYSDNELSKLPAIVCIIDECASFLDRIQDQKKRQKTEGHISELLRRGRKAKIHMVLATQDATYNAIGKATSNITSRMAFKVARYQTSISILNKSGAENLPGRGAMLYSSTECPNPVYIQGAYMEPEDVRRSVAAICEEEHDLMNRFQILEPSLTKSEGSVVYDSGFDDKREREFAEIIMWLLEQEKVSVSKIKENFSIGNRANDIMDRLCKMGLVSEKHGNLSRDVLPHNIEDILPTVMEILAHNGFLTESVQAVLNKKQGH